MDRTINLSIFEVIGSELCVVSDDGQKVYDQIVQVLENGFESQISYCRFTK
jgi:hypothetical protein